MDLHGVVMVTRAGTMRTERAAGLADAGTGPGAGTHAQLHDDDVGEPRLTTTGYGYGMFTGTFGGHAAYYHPGDNPGYLSFSGWIPDQAARPWPTTRA